MIVGIPTALLTTRSWGLFGIHFWSWKNKVSLIEIYSQIIKQTITWKSNNTHMLEDWQHMSWSDVSWWHCFGQMVTFNCDADSLRQWTTVFKKAPFRIVVILVLYWCRVCWLCLPKHVIDWLLLYCTTSWPFTPIHGLHVCQLLNYFRNIIQAVECSVLNYYDKNSQGNWKCPLSREKQQA